MGPVMDLFSHYSAATCRMVLESVIVVITISCLWWTDDSIEEFDEKKKTEKTGIEENDNVRQETDFGWGLLCEPYVLLNLSSFSFTNFGSFIVISIGPTQRKFQNKMLYIVVALEALQNLIFFFFNSVIMFHDCYNNQQN